MLKATRSKEDINDLIEKGMDTTWAAIDHEKEMEANKHDQNANVTKSFEDKDLLASLNLSEEEAKKILGE